MFTALNPRRRCTRGWRRCGFATAAAKTARLGVSMACAAYAAYYLLGRLTYEAGGRSMTKLKRPSAVGSYTAETLSADCGG